ncbi:hypothetical protein C1646_757517 [Rhizophagus diaphanus]|nr:hypothetical protein C1646_757517 [Rhizophagus diaphanus] [Rhizophagus sp. MUCL 43196]
MTQQTQEGLKNYYVAEYLKEVGLFHKKDLDSDYPIKPFQKSRPQRNNNSARINRKTGYSKGNCPKRPITQSNFTWSYFTPLTSIVPPDSDGKENGENDDEENRWYNLPVKKTDTASEFSDINDPAINALGWKANKPSNFTIKGNSKHITNSLGWYTDVPVTLKDKEDKMVTVIGNFVRIDNGETEPILFFGIKTPVVKEPPKKDQNQTSTNSSSPNSEEDLKKMRKA